VGEDGADDGVHDKLCVSVGLREQSEQSALGEFDGSLACFRDAVAVEQE
jgi:hypothetical protein